MTSRSPSSSSHSNGGQRAALESLRPVLKERLPPLNALRAFEVAARKLSFTAAAKELFVTPGAVSLHVKQLEDYLDVQLFVREVKRLRLTAEGERYLPLVSEAFSILRQATQGLRGRQVESVRLAVRPTVCHRWLLQRLPTLMGELPFCHLEIETELDREPDRYDLQVDYQPGVGAEVCSHELFRTEILPVCSPTYLAAHGLKSLGAQSDWSQLRLLHDRPLQGLIDYPGWASYLHTLGAQTQTQVGGASFANSLMCIEAARQGLGLALAPRKLVEQDLAQGWLLAPVLDAGGKSLGNSQSYYLNYHKPVLERAFVRQLVKLLLDSA